MVCNLSGHNDHLYLSLTLQIIAWCFNNLNNQYTGTTSILVLPCFPLSLTQGPCTPRVMCQTVYLYMWHKDHSLLGYVTDTCSLTLYQTQGPFTPWICDWQFSSSRVMCLTLYLYLRHNVHSLLELWHALYLLNIFGTRAIYSEGCDWHLTLSVTQRPFTPRVMWDTFPLCQTQGWFTPRVMWPTFNSICDTKAIHS